VFEGKEEHLFVVSEVLFILMISSVKSKPANFYQLGASIFPCRCYKLKIFNMS